MWLNLEIIESIPQYASTGFSYCAQVATGQVASTGMVALSYVQKVSEKV